MHAENSKHLNPFFKFSLSCCNVDAEMMMMVANVDSRHIARIFYTKIYARLKPSLIIVAARDIVGVKCATVFPLASERLSSTGLSRIINKWCHAANATMMTTRLHIVV